MGTGSGPDEPPPGQLTPGMHGTGGIGIGTGMGTGTGTGMPGMLNWACTALACDAATTVHVIKRPERIPNPPMLAL
jgi:hypothetical protein